MYLGKDVRYAKMTNRQAMESDLGEAPTIDAFKEVIKACNKDSMGGPSGLTYGLLQQMPANMIERIHACMVIAWYSGSTDGLGELKHSWIVPIPKKVNGGPKDIRPLVLAEVIRKIWVSVIASKVKRHLNRMGILTATNHAWQNRGTETAVADIVNGLEQAQLAGSDVYISSFDIKGAFPSVHYNVQRLAWMRVGVPASVLPWLVHMDLEGLGILRTPEAIRVWSKSGAAGFNKGGASPRSVNISCGFGQGLPEAPLGWNLLFDIVLRALEYHEEEPLLVASTGGSLVKVPVTAYVDDIGVPKATVIGLQEAADTFATAAMVLGLTIHTGKMRCYKRASSAIFEPQEEAIHVQLLESCPKVVVQVKGTMLILGIPLPMTEEGRKEVLKEQESLNEGRARAIAGRRAAPEVKAGVYCISPLAKTRYIGTHTEWNRKEMETLDRQVGNLMRTALRLQRGFPALLLHADWALRIPRMSGSIALGKERALGRFALGPFAGLGQALLLNASKTLSGSSPPGMAVTVRTEDSQQSLWATALIDEAKRVGLRVCIGGTKPTEANIMICDTIETLATTAKRKLTMRLIALREGRVVMGDLIGQDGAWDPPKGLHEVTVDSSPPLGQLWIRPGQLWAVDMSLPPWEVIQVMGRVGDARVNILRWVLVLDHEQDDEGTWYASDPSSSPRGAGGTEDVDVSNLCRPDGSACQVHFAQDVPVVGVDGRPGRYLHRLTGLAVKDTPPAWTPKACAPLMARLEALVPAGVTRITSDGSWSNKGTAVDEILGAGVRPCAGVAVVMEVHGGASPDVVLRSDLSAMCMQDPCQTEMVGQMLSLLVQVVARRKSAEEAPMRKGPDSYSDCKGAIDIVNNGWAWRRRASQPMFPLLGVIDAVVGKDNADIKWVKSHPERTTKNSASWTSEQWGIGLADFYADNASGSLGDRRTAVFTVTIEELEDVIRAEAPYHFATDCSKASVVLSGLRLTRSEWEKAEYCAKRNEYREARQCDAKWSPADLALALRAGHLTAGSLQNRKNRVKWIFDKFWHGGNAAKGRTRADDMDTEAICELCGDDGDGVFHIVHGCDHASVVAERTRGLCAIKTRFSAKTAPPVKGKNGLDGAAKPYPDIIRRWRFLLSNMAMDAKSDPGLWTGLLGTESREILTRWCDHNLAGEENGGEKHWGALSRQLTDMVGALQQLGIRLYITRVRAAGEADKFARQHQWNPKVWAKGYRAKMESSEAASTLKVKKGCGKVVKMTCGKQTLMTGWVSSRKKGSVIYSQGPPVRPMPRVVVEAEEEEERTLVGLLRCVSVAPQGESHHPQRNDAGVGSGLVFEASGVEVCGKL
jgi:hypothetical protein